MKSRHFLPLVLIHLVVGALTFATVYLIDWFPDQAAEQAERVDQLMWFLVISSGAIFTIVTSFLVYSVWAFRAKPGDESDGPPNHGNTALEIAWTAGPVILLAVMAVWAVIVVDRNEALAADREIVQVKAWQFAFEFSYDEGSVSSGDLVLPAGRQTELQMRSTDVIHNLAINEFRVKHDIVPGITTRVIVTPTKPGTYVLQCQELCGVGHSVMRTRAIVLPAEEYDEWIETAKADAADAPATPQPGGNQPGTEGPSPGSVDPGVDP
jgi:cytochrome c oxidase subunit II